jgi:hypothetical protein
MKGFYDYITEEMPTAPTFETICRPMGIITIETGKVGYILTSCKECGHPVWVKKEEEKKNER